MTTTINASTSNGLISTADTSGILQLQTANTTALTIDGSQNVGIGTNSPAKTLEVYNGADYQIRFRNGTTAQSYDFGRSTSNGLFTFYGNQTGFTGYVFSGIDGERMRIDTSGNVGIGTSSPYAKLSVGSASSLTNYQGGLFGAALPTGSGSWLEFAENSTNGTTFRISKDSNTGVLINANSRSIGFKANGYSTAVSDANMILDTSGNLLVGTTSQVSGYDMKMCISSDSGTNKWNIGPRASIPGVFVIAANTTYGVYLSSTTATSWSSASDERVKTDLQPIENAAEKVCSLRAVTGRYIADDSGVRKPFLIAQDVLKVLPEAVDTTNPEKYGLAYSDTIPLLVKAIQELNAKIDAQAAEIAALKGK